MYSKKFLGDYVVYLDEVLGGRYIELDSLSIVPFMTYIKVGSTELFNNLVDFSADEVAIGHMCYNYILQSLVSSLKIMCHVQLALTDPMVSIVSIYRNANWLERECWDMHGTLFIGHPDLRRILTDYGYKWHPLNKEFPLIGHIESFYDDSVKGIVYAPVEMAQTYRDFNK